MTSAYRARVKALPSSAAVPARGPARARVERRARTNLRRPVCSPRMPPKAKDSTAAGKRPAQPPKYNVEDCMKPVKKLKQKMGPSTASKKTLEDIGMSGVTKEVVAMDSPTRVCHAGA